MANGILNWMNEIVAIADKMAAEAAEEVFAETIAKAIDENQSLPEIMRVDSRIVDGHHFLDPETDAKWRAFNEWMCGGSPGSRDLDESLSEMQTEKTPTNSFNPPVQSSTSQSTSGDKSPKYPAPALTDDELDELAHKQWHEDQKWTGPKKIVLGEWASIEDFCKENPAEAVDHPVHYQGRGGLEVIDIIEGFGIGGLTPTSGFTLGNLLKYILRAGKKDDYLQDLNKAKWFLSREITNEELRRKDGKA